MKIVKALIPVLLTSALICSATAAEEQGKPKDNDKASKGPFATCIPIRNIQRIEVLDNQTILFHMLGDEVWENRLPYPCVGLKFEGGIEYKTGISNLCDKDIITIIRRGTPCSLGKFRPWEEDRGNCTHTTQDK